MYGVLRMMNKNLNVCKYVWFMMYGVLCMMYNWGPVGIWSTWKIQPHRNLIHSFGAVHHNDDDCLECHDFGQMFLFQLLESLLCTTLVFLRPVSSLGEYIIHHRVNNGLRRLLLDEGVRRIVTVRHATSFQLPFRAFNDMSFDIYGT